jgi:DNA-binding CsgD family transcriptional regulator
MHDSVLAQLGADPAATMLRPSPLTVAAVARVLGTLLGTPVDAEFARACHAATGGNPWLLQELASAIRADGIAPLRAQRIRQLAPRSVARAVTLRIASLPAGTDRLARAVSVLGRHAGPREVARLAEVDDELSGAGLDALRERGILAGNHPVEFVHPIVRSAIYREIPASRRASLHAHAAQLLISAEGDAEEIASHLLAAEPRGRDDVVQWLRRAALQALRQGAPDAAHRWLRRALAEPPSPEQRPALLGEAGLAAWQLGLTEQAVDDLRTAVAAIPPGSQRARAGLVLAQATWAREGLAAALEGLRRAIVDAACEDTELALRLEAEIGAMAFVGGELLPGLREQLHGHEELAGGTPGERAVLASCACANVSRESTAARTAQLGRRAFDGGVDADLPASIVALSGAYALIVADECEVADALLAQLHDRAARSGAAFDAVGTNIVRSLLCLHQGRMLEAEADARSVLEALGADTCHTAAPPPALAVIVESLVEQGRLADADAHLRAAQIAENIPPGASFSRLRYARARLRLAQRRWNPALDDARAAGVADERGGMLNPGVPWRSVAAFASHGAGRRDRAVALADEHLELARAWGAPSYLGEALYVRAVVGEPREMIDRLRSAVAVLDDAPARLRHARALVELGAAQRRDGLRADARATLDHALTVIDGRGADALAARAHAELEAIGDRPLARGHSGRDALTPAERRVAALAARGLSNRRIAQELFLTPKTVENHLGRIYGKLGIHAREELSVALAS